MATKDQELLARRGTLFSTGDSRTASADLSTAKD